MSYAHTTTIAEPTAAQVRYLNSLLNEATRMLVERDRITGAEWPEAVTAVARMRDTDGRTRREVSAMIDAAKTNNAQLRTELDDLGWTPAPQAATTTEYVTTGMYQVDGRVFKVLPCRNSDRHYAKELAGSSEEGFTFVFTRGAMALIKAEHKMTSGQAAEFGKLTGTCVCCGRLLTDPGSIADGIGPVCKSKHF